MNSVRADIARIIALVVGYVSATAASYAQGVIWAELVAQPAVGYGVVPAVSGGYVVAGHLAPSYDGLLVRLDGNGDTLWSSRIPHPPSGVHLLGVFRQGDSGYIAYGRPRSGPRGAFLVCIDTAGNIRWRKSVSDGIDYVSGAQGTSDGGIVVISTRTLPETNTSNGCEVVKVDAAGNEEWTRLMTIRAGTGTFGIRQLRDGGYVAITAATSPSPDYVVTRLGPAGDSIWSRIHGDARVNYMFDVAETDEGTLLVVGRDHDATSLALAWIAIDDGRFIRDAVVPSVNGVYRIERSGRGFIVGGALSGDAREGLTYIDNQGLVHSSILSAEIWKDSRAYIRDFTPLGDGRVVCTGEVAGRMAVALLQGPTSGMEWPRFVPAVMDLW